MAGMMKSTCTVLMITILVSLVVPGRVEAAISCGTVVQYLLGCIPYLTNRGPLVGSCCGGVRGLYGSARTPVDRQTACSCLKRLAGSYSVNLGKASSLPGQCGVSIPYKISPSIDCSTVH